jgi:hypothetical protein
MRGERKVSAHEIRRISSSSLDLANTPGDPSGATSPGDWVAQLGHDVSSLRDLKG